jgi:flavin-dependent dehydrogenase
MKTLEDVMGIQKDFQVAIAGAGPAGALLARDLARKGISVAVFESEKKDSLGHPWSDAVEKTSLAAAGFEIPKIVNGTYTGKLVKKDETDANLFEPHAVPILEIRAPDLSCKTRSGVEFRYITTDRVVLNRMLLEQAVDAGARIFDQHRAVQVLGKTDSDLPEICVSGIRVTDMTSQTNREVFADVVVDATGYLSLLRTGLLRATAMNRKFEKRDLAYACRTVRKLDRSKTPSDDLIDHYQYGAYKGYFWTHLHSQDVIDVGGGVPDEAGSVNPKAIIAEMIAKRPSITAYEIRGGGGMVLVGRSPYCLTASGFCAVGDAAGQVIPTTGCGVGGAMDGARMAANVIASALEKGDCGISSLWEYNRQWFSGRGSHLAALSALKEILQDLTHDDIAFLMRKNILSGEMLTPSINGLFHTPGIGEMIATLINGISRPRLLLKLNKATTLGKKIFSHYRNFPETWSADAFGAWTAKADSLFGRTS